jgi:DNA-binding transcriptional ArsR family regulator/GNAT superfamily N-acetyltransferase
VVRGSLTIHRRLRPGDLGAIIAHHGRLHARSGLGFESGIAARVAQAVLRGFPSEREAIWIVEEAGEHVGSVALTDEGDAEARVRWIAFSPRVRRRGLEKQLIDDAIAEARRLGFRRTTIETPESLMSTADAQRRAALARYATYRWGNDVLSPTESLEALLGGARAGILRRLDRERTVGELARLIDSVPSSASGHVRVLVAAGLAAREQRGRHVLVRRTVRGAALLALYEPACPVSHDR